MTNPATDLAHYTAASIVGPERAEPCSEAAAEIHRYHVDHLNAQITALRAERDAARVGWQPIETAPKDGTRIIAKFKNLIPKDGRGLRFWSGAYVVLRHPGLAEDGFDVGWSVAGPVGYGGFPDDWIEGWMSLPTPPEPGR